MTALNSIAYLIPLLSVNQEFDVTLAGVTYHLRVWWSAASACWILDIADEQRNPLLRGTPLVTGCDLFEQYGYLVFNGALVVQSSNDANLVPTSETLGSTGNLFFLIPTAGNV
jgi:hypothetical protein